MGLVAFLIVQLAIPTILLFGERDRSARFGWQMFTYAAAFEVSVLTASGSRVVPLEEVLARPRADMPLDKIVPPYLCANVVGALRVVWDGGSLEC
jgi:hypothetical protein